MRPGIKLKNGYTPTLPLATDLTLRFSGADWEENNLVLCFAKGSLVKTKVVALRHVININKTTREFHLGSP